MRKKGLIIAIDGPAGVGKSTISRFIAEKADYVYINTGAMYRAVAWLAYKKKLALNNEKEISKIADNIDIHFEVENKKQKIFINGIDSTLLIRPEEIGKGASIVSKISGVRKALSATQKKMGKDGGVVMEGRDIGTVIFPDAEIKFFMTATVKERANRRYLELKKRESSIKFEEIFSSIAQRDREDQSRSLAPLKKAYDAIEIDTTHLSVDEVVTFMIKNYMPFLC